MRRSDDFREAVRTGVRTGRPTLVVHAVTSPAQDGVRVGFVVSKAVGNAVTRNRVKRRLRHLSLQEIPRTPAGTRIVVRALWVFVIGRLLEALDTFVAVILGVLVAVLVKMKVARPLGPGCLRRVRVLGATPIGDGVYAAVAAVGRWSRKRGR